MGARWRMPVFGLVLGVAICALAAIAGQAILGLGLFAIMAIYSAIVLAFGERRRPSRGRTRSATSGSRC